MTLVSRVSYSDIQLLRCGFLLNFNFLSCEVKKLCFSFLPYEVKTSCVCVVPLKFKLLSELLFLRAECVNVTNMPLTVKYS